MISMYKIPSDERPLEFLAKRAAAYNKSGTLIIVPTKRNLHKLVTMGVWEADIQTVADFNSRAMVHKSVLLPPELRDYYLYKAATELSGEEQDRLMSRNASSFLKNYIEFIQRSSALLPFFRELCAEQVDIELLMKASLYQDYEEQLLVLARLWELYLRTIHSLGYVDEWESYSDPMLDAGYINRYERYIFLVGGYLNNFELVQMLMLADIKDVEIYFNYTGDLHPQAGKFAELFDIGEVSRFEMDKALAWTHHGAAAAHTDGELIINVSYTGNPLYASKYDLASREVKMQIVPCESALAQYDMITRQICAAHWIEGIDFSDMAVVLPGERMAEWFLYSDPYGLYSVSAGRSITSFPFFQLLEDIAAIFRNMYNGLIKLTDIERVFAQPLFKHFENTDVHGAIKALRVLNERGRLFHTFDELKHSDAQGMASLYRLIQPFTEDYADYSYVLSAVRALFMTFKDASSGLELEALMTTVDEIDKMLLLYANIGEELPVREVLHRVVQELSQIQIPVERGQVRVMGLLESRNMDYKLIFIPDMNEGIFPADQNKDLFMNSELRQELALPTFSDRQELQKSYMSQLFARAKCVYIAYTKSEETQPSLFINEILTNSGYAFDDSDDEQRRSSIIYRPDGYLLLPEGNFKPQPFNAEIIKDDSMVRFLKGFRYSASTIGTIKSCEYKFFYRWVAGIRPAGEAVEEAGAKETGTILHNILDKLFKQGAKPTDNDYLERLCKLFDEECAKYDYFKHNRLGVYEAKAMKLIFPAIVEAERARLNAGAVPQSYEADKESNFKGVRIKARIDRWDKTPSGYAIIDYKYMDYDKLKQVKSFKELDVQLPLYALIMKEELGAYPTEILWFALKKNPSFVEAYNPEDMDSFVTELEAFFNEWFTPDLPLKGAADESACRYCDFAAFCPKRMA